MNSNIEIQLSNLPTINNYPSNFYAHPNPFSNELTVTIDQGNVDEIHLVSLDGKIVYQSNFSGYTISINTDAINSGFYSLQLIYKSNLVTSKKVVKL